jgi:hypothetical protein
MKNDDALVAIGISVGVIVLCLGLVLGVVIGENETKSIIRNQVIERNLGKWVIDPKTGDKTFESPIAYLK